MTPIISILILISSGITIFFVNTLKPSSATAFVFITIWLILPYLIMSGTLFYLHREKTVTIHWYVTTAIVTIGGNLLLADIVFWHPDAQGAIAVFMLPIFQGIACALLLPLCRLLAQYPGPK